MSREERSRQLLDVAERLIARRGVVATSMDDVAEAAGVTKPVVYDHFGSKDGLLCALIARAGEELHHRTTAAVAGAGEPLDVLERGLRAYFETLDRRDGVWWALLDATAAVSPATMAELDRIRTRQAAFIAELIAAQIADDGERALVYAHSVVGACERLAALRAQHTELGVEAATRHLLELLWCGFDDLRLGRGLVERS
jgi:AcrR family transcriptional regulator